MYKTGLYRVKTYLVNAQIDYPHVYPHMPLGKAQFKLGLTKTQRPFQTGSRFSAKALAPSN